MLSLLWVFLGFVSGLLIVSVFDPPFRKVPSLPTPGDHEPFHTKMGCVHILSEETPCTPDSVSLNLIRQ